MQLGSWLRTTGRRRLRCADYCFGFRADARRAIGTADEAVTRAGDLGRVLCQARDRQVFRRTGRRISAMIGCRRRLMAPKARRGPRAHVSVRCRPRSLAVRIGPLLRDICGHPMCEEAANAGAQLLGETISENSELGLAVGLQPLRRDRRGVLGYKWLRFRRFSAPHTRLSSSVCRRSSSALMMSSSRRPGLSGSSLTRSSCQQTDRRPTRETLVS